MNVTTKHGTDLRPFNFGLALLIAAKIVLLFILAWTVRFVMDEFEQVGYAKHLPAEFFHTLWPPKAIGFAVFYKLAHLIGWDATSILLIARMQTALLACATLGIVYAIARRLGGTRLRALATVFILLCFSNFIERSVRTIAEPLAVFFATASLLAAVRGDPDRRRNALAAGLLTGLAFVSTQKSLYFNVALGLALVGDAMLARQYKAAFARGASLVLGWGLAVAAYCLIFGGTDPAPILRNLLFGPLQVAVHGGDAYGGTIRRYVIQTLTLNAGLYAVCLAGMVLQLARIARLDGCRRIALIFTVVMTLLVFAHNQPWPYVFIMAQPFIALWATVPFERLGGIRLRLVWALLSVAVAVSFARNLLILRVDNREQLKLVVKAEALLPPDEVYFDGIGMLPNRREPSTLWLDRQTILETLRDGKHSEAYRIFTDAPPEMILWSYRLDAVLPVVGPVIRNSYVQIAPNIRIAGLHLRKGERSRFNVPVAGRYALYDLAGRPLDGQLTIDGSAAQQPVPLRKGWHSIALPDGPAEGLLLPEGSYVGLIKSGADDENLFADVYK